MGEGGFSLSLLAALSLVFLSPEPATGALQVGETPARQQKAI